MKTSHVIGRIILAWVALGALAFVAAAVVFALEPSSGLAPALLIFAAAGVAALAVFVAWSKRGRAGAHPARRTLPAGWILLALAVILLAASLLWNPQQLQISRLIRDLGGRETHERAFTTLTQEMGAAAIQPLITALRDKDPQVRQGAKDALIAIGPPAVEPLVEALIGYDPEAGNALVAIGAPAVTPLIAALGRPDLDVRGRWAVQGCLRRIGLPAVEALAAAAGSGDAQIRNQALEVLFAAGDSIYGEYDIGIMVRRPPAGEAAAQMAALITAALRDDDAGVRLRALTHLATVPWMADRRVPLFIAALADAAPAVRQAAAGALGAEKDELSIRALAVALRDSDAGVRTAAALALAETGPAGTDALVASFSAQELDAAAAGFREMIAGGQPGTEAVLIAALFARNENGMPDLFLDCGNSILRAATYEWARQHGFTITYLQAPAGAQPGGEAAWGSKK